ncbi:DUF2956 domain-containing protein [Psychromonas aquimarina]|uniref:DUF2956 domain-containing protein n=1 Tax=Psychromonas aquimarina TaxID=444919 RepID=UPI000423A05E|nr:DUF2956 domain-containing protein [Psychromonas aquimarina]
MAKNKKNEISAETQDEALAIAKKTQKPGQTKEQTRLIAQGIQKGIAEYKKTAKEKLRQADKANKKKKRQQQQQVTEVEIETTEEKNSKLPWVLLALSWAAFGIYFLSQI